MLIPEVFRSTSNSGHARLLNYLWCVCMQTSLDTDQLDSIEYAAHYASAAPTFFPFKGRSHTVEGNANAAARRPTAAFIPAVHQQRTTSSRHQAAVHSLTSTSALRPLQREEFLATLPKVKGFTQCWLHCTAPKSLCLSQEVCSASLAHY